MIWLAKLLIARNPAMTLEHAKRLVRFGLIAAVVLVLLGVGLWLYLSGRSDGAAGEKLEQARIDTQAVTTAREADGSAQTTVSQVRASTAASEAKAREAAAQSDDPLKAGLDSLRNEK